MKKYLMAMIFALTNASFSAGSMTVEEVVQQLEGKFLATQMTAIRPILEEAKLGEDIFAISNNAAKIEFLQHKDSMLPDELLAFAEKRRDEAKAQMDRFYSVIDNYPWKSITGRVLSTHMPHMGLNGSPQMYEDWIVEVEKLSK